MNVLTSLRSDATAIRVHSELLGELSVPTSQVIEFPQGLFGFPACRRWALVPAAHAGFFWLQSVDQAALALLLVDPFDQFPGYAVELPAADLHELAAPHAADVAIFAIVTLPVGDGPMTANLQGPLAIALGSRRGRQLVSPDARSGARQPLRAVAA